MATIPNEYRESSWRCPRIAIRADNGGFYEPDSSPQPLLRREVESLRPPSGEVSRCLALIPGESRNSGRGLGFDARANLDGVKNDFLGS